MKKFIIPLLACTALAGGIALAAAPKAADGPFGRHRSNAEGFQRHHAMICSNLYAGEAGRMAFIEAKLSLSGAQASAFDKWKAVKLSEARAHAAKCATLAKADATEPSPLAHMAREEERLKTRLTDLQTERPVLTAFYNSLSDTQKRDFAMEGHRHGGPGMMGRHMMRGPIGHRPHGPEDGPAPDDGAPPPQGE